MRAPRANGRRPVLLEKQNTPDQNCGWAEDGCSQTNVLAADGTSHDTGVAEGDVQACRTKCEQTAGCVAVNYAKPGQGGSGGPGSTISGSGTCYYRSATACGLWCQAGRDCWRLTGEDCARFPRTNARVVAAAVCDPDEFGEGCQCGMIVAIFLIALMMCLGGWKYGQGRREAAENAAANPVVVTAEAAMPSMATAVAVAVAVPVAGAYSGKA